MTSIPAPRRRRPFTRVLVAASLALAATPAILLATSGPASAAATVSPAKVTGIDPAGEAITVEGSGFDSTRGIYLMFCKQVGTSGTASGRPGSASCSGAQAWITAPGPGVPPSGTTPWTGDGTFSVTLSATSTWGSGATAVDCRAAGTVCGFVTRNDHREPGVYDHDTFTPVTFAEAVPEPTGPTVTVAPTVGLDAAGDSVTVEGTGIPAGQGVYVRFCEAPVGTVGTAGGRPPAGTCDGEGLWVTPDPPPGAPLPTIDEGAFSVELDVVGAFAGDPDAIDCTAAGSCGVFVRRDHNGGATDLSLDSFTPLTFDPSTTPPEVEAPEPPANEVVVELSADTDLADGQTVTVDGSRFAPDQGVYVMFCAEPEGRPGTPAGRATRCYPGQDNVHTVWVTPIAEDGTFSTPLTVEAAFTTAADEAIDCKVESCGVFVRRDHNGGTTDHSQDAFVPVTFGDGTAPPVEEPTLSADRTDDLDPAGDTVTIAGAGYRPGMALFVGLCDPSVDAFGACDFDQVVEVTTSTGEEPASARAARAAGGAGTFSVGLDVRAAFGDTDCATAGTSCAVRTWAVSAGDGSEEASLPVTFAARAGGSGPTTSTPTAGAAAGDPAVADATLPRTGSSTTGLAALGGGLAALGAVVLAARRRWSAA